MGSSGTRKPNDTLRINKPAAPTNTNGANLGGGAGGESSTPPDINNLCPIRFRVKLARTDLAPGIALTLDEATHVLTTPNGESIGKISTQTIKRIETCAKLSIAYPTIITVVDRGDCYAEFSQ